MGDCANPPSKPGSEPVSPKRTEAFGQVLIVGQSHLGKFWKEKHHGMGLGWNQPVFLIFVLALFYRWGAANSYKRQRQTRLQE